MLNALANPAVLSIILAAFGGAIAWLWAKIISMAKTHLDCEKRLARAEEGSSHRDSKIAELEGSVKALTDILRKRVLNDSDR